MFDSFLNRLRTSQPATQQPNTLVRPEVPAQSRLLQNAASTVKNAANTVAQQQPTAPTPAVAQPAQTTNQVQQEQENFLKTMQDMYDREAKNAQARQAQNLNAASLNAQQTAALAGYNPDMASRAMFEQTAGAYNANQNIENELARYGLEVAGKRYDIARDADQTAYSRNQYLLSLIQQGGYDNASAILSQFIQNGGNLADAIKYLQGSNPDLWKITPDDIKALDLESAQYAELKRRAELNDEVAIRQLAAMEASYGKDTQTTETQNLQNKITADANQIIRTGSTEGLSNAEIINAVNHELLGEQVKAALKGTGSTAAGNLSVGGFPEVKNPSYLQGYQPGEMVFYQGNLIKISSQPQLVSTSSSGSGTSTYKISYLDMSTNEYKDVFFSRSNN